MDFLKELLGDDLFNQVAAKINEHNGNEANKQNQIKIGNLGSGEYVSKLKYDGLDTQLQGKISELASANDLIKQLQKDNKGNEGLQNQITAYETQVAQLQEELAETKLKSALKAELMSANAVDVDYLTFKLQEKMKEKGEKLELDDNDKIKHWETQLEGLKTQFPNMFKVEGGDGLQVYNPQGLPKGSESNTTKEQFAAMTYEQRVKLKQSNEKLYKQLAH